MHSSFVFYPVSVSLSSFLLFIRMHYMEILAHLNDPILTCLTYLKLYFQIRLYSAELGLRGSICASVDMVGSIMQLEHRGSNILLLEEWTVRAFSATIGEER